MASLSHKVATIGLFLYAAFAPHSIAGAEIAIAVASVGWLVRTAATGRTGLRRTALDLPVWLLFMWTTASAFLSEEPRISFAKIQSVCVFLVFYLIRAVVTRRVAIYLVVVMILSGVTGALGSAYDLARGRGVIIESIARESPFHETGAEKGDAVWRVGGQRVYSVAAIDQAVRNTRTETQLSVSLITHGEHIERPGFLVTDQLKAQSSPAGITGAGRTHRFRASGWTRHYETFSEILQIIAQLSLGLAVANLLRHGANRQFKLAIAASLLLGLGLALTAMRTALVAFAVGAGVVVWRATRGTTRLLITAAIAFVLVVGALVVRETRAKDALLLEDPSSSLRVRVARVGLSRVMLHPLFGHGMDAVLKHWTEWGFPGSEKIHFHSTPLQITFDRGLPALIFWLWIMAAAWLLTSGAEKATRDSSGTNRHGVLLGATGALAGFVASSLVNYNFGAGIVALVFWWLMGTVVVLVRDQNEEHVM